MREELVIALPQGKLGESVVAHFAQAGFEVPLPTAYEKSLYLKWPVRKDRHQPAVKVLWLKPRSIPSVMKASVAHLGFTGSDIWLNYNYSINARWADILPGLDLGWAGTWQIVLAARSYKDLVGSARIGYRQDLKIASDYLHIAQHDYPWAEVVDLQGSSEAVIPYCHAAFVVSSSGETLKRYKLNCIRSSVHDHFLTMTAQRVIHGNAGRAADRLLKSLPLYRPPDPVLDHPSNKR